MTRVVVTVLCTQPKAFASDLGYDQSRYLCFFGVEAHHFWLVCTDVFDHPSRLPASQCPLWSDMALSL